MSKPLPPIEVSHRTLAAQVTERIRLAILNHTLLPGSRINQHQLAEDLDVSLVPVREALKTLEAEGLVTINPRRGAFVTAISLDDLDELYAARQFIEGEAIRLAVDHLTQEDFAALHAMIVEMQQMTARGSIPEFIRLNRAFHMRIYQAMRNRHLYHVVDTLWERSELYRYRYMFVIRNAETIHQEHLAIHDALVRRDADAASALAREHIHHTRNGLYARIAEDIQSAPPPQPDPT
jgi:DNA-binding GntR family transcriptional regulator